MIEDVLVAVRDEIKSAAPALATCDIYDGELTDRLLETLMSKGTPSVHVSFVGTGGIQTDNRGQPVAELAMMAFVLTRHYRDRGPRQAATDLCELIADMALNYCWGLTSGVQPARDLRIDNLYSGEVEQEGVALYSVGWKQPVRWGVDRSPGMDLYPELDSDGSSGFTWQDFQDTSKWYLGAEEFS